MATVTNWIDHLSAEKVSGAVYPFLGTEWIWLLVAVIFWLWWHVTTAASEQEEQEKLARKKHGDIKHISNIPEW
jgi:hypothetical protein